jgi:hypothetical protein
MKHLMIDIETLGTGPNAVITSISAVQFDLETGETGKEFHKPISIQSCLDAGLEVEAGTLLWWMGNADDERGRFIQDQKEAVSLKTALLDLNSFMITTFTNGVKDVKVWGNGATFDISKIENAAYKSKTKLVWDSKNAPRDVRTLVDFNPVTKDLTEFVGTKHFGIDDCKHQIKYCCEIWKSFHTHMTIEPVGVGAPDNQPPSIH